MSKKEKLIIRLLSRPKDFRYEELKALLTFMGFEEITKGKTAGSRVKYYHEKLNLIIRMHRPHGGQAVRTYAINEIIDKLKLKGLV